jgi:hypothetical protein
MQAHNTGMSITICWDISIWIASTCKKWGFTRYFFVVKSETQKQGPIYIEVDGTSDWLMWLISPFRSSVFRDIRGVWNASGSSGACRRPENHSG